MKFKHRALSLLLSLAMVLTFMPALAFADEGYYSDGFDGDIVVEDTIEVGETKNITISNPYDYASFTFIPAVSGLYCFRSDGSIDPYGRVLDSDMNILESMDDWEDDDEGFSYNFAIDFQAEQGETYYLQASNYGKGIGSFTVELLEGSHEPASSGGYNPSAEGNWFNGTYTGTPSVSINEDESLEYWFTFTPGNGDVIKVDTNEGEKTYTFEDYDGEAYWFANADNTDSVYAYYEYEEGSSECYLSIFNDNSNWRSGITLKDIPIKNNSVTRIIFEPATIYLTAESIIESEGDDTFYYFAKRSKHSAGGQSWYSAFAAGDKLTVYYKDGTTKTFMNSDKHFTGQDEDGEYDYYDDYFINGDYKIWPKYDKYQLNKGNNTVVISWHGVSTSIKVVVETAAEKAAREAADKAAADKAAADKAAADKAAADKAAADKAAAEAAAAAAAAEAKAKSVKTVTVNVPTVTAAAIDKAVKALGGSEKYVTKIVLGKKVKKISKNAFKKYTKVKTIELKTKKLKKAAVKGSLKGSKVTKVVVKVGSKAANKKQVKAYKKIFTKANAGKKVSVK